MQVHPAACPFTPCRPPFAGLAAGPEGEQLRIPRECWGGVGKSLNVVRPGERGTAWRDCSGLACLAIRFSVGCVLIIRLIIQTILLDPSRAVWTDEAPNVSRLHPSGAIQGDAEHPTRNRKVVGSNPTSGSKTARQSA